jgi:branched-chain amino acid transport system substrate-binding protein
MKRSGRLLTLTLTAMALVLFASGASAFAKDAAPVKIGFMAPYVGVLAKAGKDMERGFRMALEEANYTIGGRKIVLITQDDEGKPELGPTKARKLIDDDKVDMVAGIVHSGVALSIRDLVVERKVPMITTNAGAIELTGKLKSPYIFRAAVANGQQDLVGGWYACKKLGFKRMILLAADYNPGREKAEAFSKTYVAAGGQVVEEIFAPANTIDFGPYLSKIAAKAKSADAIWSFFPGSPAIRLVTQYQEYGLKDSLPLFVIGDTVDEAFLPSMKDAALGIKSYLQYSDMIKSADNENFVKAFFDKHKEYPSIFAEQGYVGAKAIVLALKAVKGNMENKEPFMAALRKVTFAAPHGRFAFDANQSGIVPIYIREVRKVEGRYANVVLDMIPDVDQNWTPDRLKKN